jgi:hypothetical protein
MNTEILTYIHADPHDAFFILVAVMDGDDVGMVADDAVELTVKRTIEKIASPIISLKFASRFFFGAYTSCR